LNSKSNSKVYSGIDDTFCTKVQGKGKAIFEFINGLTKAPLRLLITVTVITLHFDALIGRDHIKQYNIYNALPSQIKNLSTTNNTMIDITDLEEEDTHQRIISAVLRRKNGEIKSQISLLLTLI
jgi:hypothetical protein